VPFGLSPALAALALGVVAFGGLVKGTAGFGYAVAGTALLATLLSPDAAVVLMILPVMAGNVALLRELDRDSFRACARRFGPYLAGAVAGTLAGMALLDRVPTARVALGLGVLVGGYVLLKQPYARFPGEAWLRDRCFRDGAATKAGLGLASSVVFGASNIGVQVVAYLDALDLDRSTFVGVLSMVLVGVSAVRVAAAWQLGLYDGTGGADLLALSAVAVVPGLAGVAAGQRVRERVPGAWLEAATLALLAVVAVRLTTAGLGGL